MDNLVSGIYEVAVFSPNEKRIREQKRFIEFVSNSMQLEMRIRLGKLTQRDVAVHVF